MEDAELVRAFQAGDRDAFTDLVGRHREMVWRVARGILGRNEDADEASQDALLKAYHGLPSFKGESSLKTWLCRIAMNAAYDIRAKQASRARTRSLAEQEALSDARPTRGPRALEQLLRDEEIAGLRAAVEKLPERQRLTLMLRVREGLKYTEIAEALDCPVGTAKANFHHAVQNLRRQLGGGDVEPDSAVGRSVAVEGMNRRTRP